MVNYFVIEPRYESTVDEDGSPLCPKHQINHGINEHESDSHSENSMAS